MVGIIDTHCHLYYENLYKEVDSVIRRAVDNGIEAFVVPGVDAETSLQALQLAEMYSMIYAAVGIHPNSNVQNLKLELEQVQNLLSHPKVVAIGEIGLDYYRNKENAKDQQQLLMLQLRMATEFRLPVILHNRNAIEDLFDCVLKWQDSIRPSQDHKELGVFHAFSEDVSWAKRIIQLGFSIGIGGTITYPNANKLQEVAKGIPIDRLVVETDAPFLPPQPYRGKRNEPSYLPIVLDKLSIVLNQDRKTLIEMTNQNSKILFGIN